MEYIPAKTIITKNKPTSFWFDCDYNMNIYKGCCHGCIYCDSRSECYRIDNFDRVRAKENCLQIIRDELRRKVKTGVVSMGAMSDPYNPHEKELQLTRHALELINAYEFGTAIATKSNLITRDIDILKDIKFHSPVLAKLTITCADDNLSKKIERNVCTSSQRFEAIEKLSSAGIFSGVLLMPILPFVNDTIENITTIVKRAKECGAKFVYADFGVTLRQNQREYYYDRLKEIFPDENLVPKYVQKYGNNYQCGSPRYKELWKGFSQQCENLGIAYRMKDINTLYRRGYQSNQLSFF